MRRWREFIIHPVLFSIYPVVFLFSRNVPEIKPSELVMPLLISVAICAVVWGVSSLFLKSISKGALVASLSMIMLLLFAQAYDLLGLLPWLKPSNKVKMLMGWTLLYILGLFLLWRIRRKISLINRFGNIVSIILLVIACIPIIAYYSKPESKFHSEVGGEDLVWINKWRDSGNKTPDIYYIILDGYGRADQIERVYQFKNDAFLESLKSRGFFIANRSTSNYPFTHESIASSLNMKYVHENTDAKKRKGMELLLDRNRVGQLFRSLGYKYILVPSGYYITDKSQMADWNVDLGVEIQSRFASLIMEGSAIWFIAKWIDTNWYHLRTKEVEKMAFRRRSSMVAWQEHINKAIEAIGKIAEIREPTFTFAHIVCPHPPYVFKRDGSLNGGAKIIDLGEVGDFNYWMSKEEFVDQLFYLNSILEKLISSILKNSSEPPIIILHGDHGSAFHVGPKWGAPENPSEELLKERMAIFFAFYGPQEIKSKLYDSITPVNLFRIVFDEYFGATYPLLPNKNFWGYIGRPMIEVTEIVAK